MIKNTIASLLSILIITYILVQAGYFNIEQAQMVLHINQYTPRGDSLITNYQSTSSYIGFPDTRIQNFEQENKNNQVKYLISKLSNNSRYHEFSHKDINISIQVRELNSTPKDTFTLHITGTVSGFCSPQSARELTQLFLARLEYGLIY
jgi:uncharacterized protein YxeA